MNWINSLIKAYRNQRYNKNFEAGYRIAAGHLLMTYGMDNPFDLYASLGLEEDKPGYVDGILGAVDDFKKILSSELDPRFTGLRAARLEAI